MKQTHKSSKTICFRQWTGASYAVFNSLNKVVKIGVMGLSCSLLTLKTQPILAQSMTSDSLSKDSAAIEIEGVVVTAPNLIPLNLGVEVVATIQKKDIEQAGVQNLQDLLRYVQGIDLRSRGSENVQADLSIRGGTFDQTVILLNGVNFSDPQTGHNSLNLPVNFSDIERIEILQGISSWQYGASPFTAAINIVTNAQAKTQFKAGLSGGMYGYIQGELSGNYKYKKWNFGLSAAYTKSDGYASNTDFSIPQGFLQISYTDPKRVGNFFLQGGYQQKDFGANSFYSLKYREQYESTKVFLGSLAYSKQIQKFKINAELYYRQHHDRFALFRHEAPAWYTGANYHKTDVG
ncbi:MAG: TonB-dependent receptor plug domain-containing protein, partial [Bacteroidales bacterium]